MPFTPEGDAEMLRLFHVKRRLIGLDQMPSDEVAAAYFAYVRSDNRVKARAAATRTRFLQWAFTVVVICLVVL